MNFFYNRLVLIKAVFRVHLRNAFSSLWLILNTLTIRLLLDYPDDLYLWFVRWDGRWFLWRQHWTYRWYDNFVLIRVWWWGYGWLTFGELLRLSQLRLRELSSPALQVVLSLSLGFLSKSGHLLASKDVIQVYVLIYLNWVL